MKWTRNEDRWKGNKIKNNTKFEKIKLDEKN